ncbi:MAG: signal peptide peptidase SppA [Prolixibacteraceae bacterium]|nr:signal peptide peptidase SppA [Prolixibacteraceae bacterium]
MKDFFKYVLATIVGIFAVSLISMIMFFFMAGIMVAISEKQGFVHDNSMLFINLEHSIVDRAPNDPFQNMEIPGFERMKTIGLDEIHSSLEKAVTDDRIKGVFVKLSVINGGMASVEEIRNELNEFREKCDKPVYAYGNTYDQKAYYLATAADKIIIHPMGSVDFRGLGGEMMFFVNALEKAGIEMQIVRHGKFKSAVEPFMLEKMSDENREQMMTYMGSLWDHMLEGISKSRNIPVDRLNELADQVQTFSWGEDIVSAGLADEAKYKDEVIDDLREITGIEGTKGVPVISAGNYAKMPSKDKKKKLSRNKLAVIYASGDIGASMGGEAIIGDELGREIRKVRQDSSYKAIVLRVNSPGGSLFDSEVIWREVKLAADEKTMVVSFGDVAASGGYYISCGADRIVSHPNTITGSIGIFGMIPNFGELLNEKLGISTDVVKTNQNSDLLSVTRPMTQYEKDLMQNYIEDGYDAFVSHVSEGRGLTKEQVDEIGQGRVWSGINARELNLVDQFGGLNEAVKLAAEIEGLEDYRQVALPAQPDPFSQLFKSGTDNIRNGLLKKELGEHYRYYKFLKAATKLEGIYARMPFDLFIN